MQIELHRNNVYQGVELLLLVYMLFLLAIPKCLLIFKENFYYTSYFSSYANFGLLAAVARTKVHNVTGNKYKFAQFVQETATNDHKCC